MKVMDFLLRDAVLLDIKGVKKREVLLELATALASSESSLDADDLFKVLEDREELQSTGIGDGVAIPHGKMAKLPRLVACFARSKRGIDFNSIDGQLTHLFFLLAVPEESGGQHLKALARISRFFRDAEFRKRLIEADGVGSVLGAIEEEDEKF